MMFASFPNEYESKSVLYGRNAARSHFQAAPSIVEARYTAAAILSNAPGKARDRNDAGHDRAGRPLPHASLPEGHGAGSGHVERIDPMGHGDAHGHVAASDGAFVQPIALGAEDQRQPLGVANARIV